ncbi:MAG: redox-sensing transcriptional repressor Rex [Anaerolineales bacterium]
MPSHPVPDIVVGRLPVYLRALTAMTQEGKVITSSQELATRLGFTSAQIRKDLSHFGEFGKQGLGYNIPFLSEQLRHILKLDRIWGVVLVGAGDLGRALANFQGFQERGFEIRIVFDSNPAKIGQSLGRFVIQDIDQLVPSLHESDIRIAMLAVPARVAQEVTGRLVEAGIRAILNYAPTTLSVPSGVFVQNIDPAVHLQRMTYYLLEHD